MTQMTQEISESSHQQAWILLFLCWIIAVTAMLGSLFFSSVMGLEPCVLCWYQRIFMYPLVVIFLIGLFPFDAKVVRYSMPLVVIGWIFAVYHYLVYSGYIPENLQPCDESGVSCSEINLELFGIITIPMMSILAYSTIIILLFLIRIRSSVK